MDIVIRKATPTDLPALQKLGTELMLSEARFDPLLDKQWYLSEHGAEYLLNEIRGTDHICFVAQAEDELIGYASCKIVAEDTSRPGKRAELDNLVVTEQYRGHGAGHQLVATFKQWAKEQGATKVRLVANALNEDALRFYGANGFKDFQVIIEADLLNEN